MCPGPRVERPRRDDGCAVRDAAQARGGRFDAGEGDLARRDGHRLKFALGACTWKVTILPSDPVVMSSSHVPFENSAWK